MKIPCPLCKKMTDTDMNQYKPFCSERCKLIDLGAWLHEEYTVEGQSEFLSHEYPNEGE